MRISDWSSDVCSSDLAFRYQCGGHQRRARSFDQGQRYRMIGHADAYGLARGMRYPARHFTSGFQNKRPGTRRSQFKETVLLIVYPGEMADFGQVATKQRQVVAFVRSEERRVGKEGVSTCRIGWS